MVGVERSEWRAESMIRRLSHATIYCRDQEEAKSFYADKVGFRGESRRDPRRLSLAHRGTGRVRSRARAHAGWAEPHDGRCDSGEAG
ncbi:MAG: VOC family protein [Egibacteraceae bacterium]